MKDLTNENVLHKVKDNIEYLQFRRLLEFEKDLNHMYILKNKDLDFNIRATNVKEKHEAFRCYEKVCALEGMNYKRIVKPSQTHSDHMVIIDEENVKPMKDALIASFKDSDGLATKEKKLVLSAANADCILLIFFDPVKKVVANIHSGWKGTFKKYSKKAAEKLKEQYGSNPEDIICCMTPSIGKCCFEVHSDVKDECEKIFAYTKRLDEIIEFNRMEDGLPKYNIDLILINQIILQEAGLKKENIISSNICSVCHSDKIHSRRVEGPDYKVGISLVELK